MTERLTSVWIRPAKARRDQPSLSRDQIVDAALELLDAEGLTGLSMRRLGTKLNSGATSVYWHVTNKDELLELAIDRVMAEVRIPAGTDWRTAVSGYARSLRAVIHRHPWTVTLFGGRPMLGPNATRVMDEILGVLATAGFTGYDLEYAWSLVVDYVIGAAGSEASWQAGNVAVSAEELMASLEPYMARIGGSHPRLAAHIRDVWTTETADVLEGRFSFGLDCLLDGIAARLP